MVQVVCELDDPSQVTFLDQPASERTVRVNDPAPAQPPTPAAGPPSHVARPSH